MLSTFTLSTFMLSSFMLSSFMLSAFTLFAFRPAAEVAPVLPAAMAQVPPVDLAALAAAQAGCPDCARAVTSDSLRVEKVSLGGSDLLVDMSRGVLRPLPFRWQIFKAIHQLAHPGIRASRRLIGRRFLWPNLAKDVAEWCKQCTHCQAAKVTKQPTAEVQPIPTPIHRFTNVHVDLVGPLPLSAEGYAYLLTAVDRTSRWFEAVPLRSITAADVAEVSVAAWVARFGVPATITSDRGVQFSSALWAAAMKKLGIKHLMMMAFHPQSNGAHAPLP
jgi:transposase InsO family protein